MSGRVEFDAGARRRLREGWRADAGGVLVAQGDAQCAPRSSATSATLATSDARRRASTAVASLAFFVAIGLFAAILHGARDGGFLPHAPDRGAVARGAAAAGRASRGSEVDVRDSVIFAAGTVAAFALSFGAAGAELMVPEKYPTIAAALATATSNDVVSIAPGTYNVGLMRMPSFPITLRGRGDEESVVILGESIEVFAGSGPRRIENLTLRGMTGYAAVHVDGAQLVMEDVMIELTPSMGLFLNTNASAVTTRCNFRQNGKGGYGYVNCFWNAVDCTFEQSNSTDSYGGVVAFHIGSGCAFLRCRFIGNFAVQGGAIGLSFSGSRLFDECYFEGNSSPDGAVWWTEFGATGTLKNSVLCGHSPSDIHGSWIDGGGNQFFPKGCTPPCPADFVDDGAVNAADLGVLLNFWGTNGSQFPGVDLNGDGIVGAADLSALLSSWGPCPE